MTTEDLMKLADAYAETMYLRQDRYEARKALLDALEALGQEVAIEIELRGKAEQGLVDWAVKYANLEAEIAAIRAQEPVAEFAEDFIFNLRKQPNGERWPVGTKLYVSPAAKDAGLVADAARYRWLTNDHEDAEMRDRAEDMGVRLRWIGKGAADAAIDAAMLAASPKLGGV